MMVFLNDFQMLASEFTGCVGMLIQISQQGRSAYCPEVGESMLTAGNNLHFL